MENKKIYDIGIVGWWSNLNYGGTLTYYALNNAIKDLGYSVLMIEKSRPRNSSPNQDSVPRRFAKKYYDRCYLETFSNMERANSFYMKSGFVELDKPLVPTEHYACDMWYIKSL